MFRSHPRHPKPLLLENRIYIVALTPYLQRVPIYSILAFGCQFWFSAKQSRTSCHLTSRVTQNHLLLATSEALILRSKINYCTFSLGRFVCDRVLIMAWMCDDGLAEYACADRHEARGEDRARLKDIKRCLNVQNNNLPVCAVRD
jgi:hypothetical protein